MWSLSSTVSYFYSNISSNRKKNTSRLFINAIAKSIQRKTNTFLFDFSFSVMKNQFKKAFSLFVVFVIKGVFKSLEGVAKFTTRFACPFVGSIHK